jgi:RND family efflux transporter MFP subunit
MADDREETLRAQEAEALAELTLCENLAQTSGWAARWSATETDADGALLWAPDALHPLFLCIAGVGDGSEKALRRSVPSDKGFVAELVEDGEPRTLGSVDLLAASDPFLKAIPRGVEAALVLPLQAEGIVVGILTLYFKTAHDTDEALATLESFADSAAPALGRALRSERKTVGMLRAIERLTNLFDLSKAFGSTIDLSELSRVIVVKAADFLHAEAASLWLLDGEEVVLEATAVNESYTVDPAPESVGSSIAADVLVGEQVMRKNQLPEGDPIKTADPDYPVKSILAVPILEDEKPIGALVLTNKRGRHPDFTPADEELVLDLARQAVRALHNARLYEAEKKVEELDALLAVSREITATLDLDKVMATVVNASSALVHYDRCAIAVLQRGKLRLGAVSGMAEIDRGDESVKRTEALLEWVFFGGADVAVTQQEDGAILTDRPETEEKFRTFFAESRMRAFFGVLLKDEEGKLGVLGFESEEPIVFDQETRDLMQILVNQATVAVRNAQLYQQVPLAGFWKPLLEKRRKLAEVPARRALRWALSAAAALVLLFLVPWRLRVDGPARVAPAKRTSVAASVDGFVDAVLHREGDRVEKGDVLATQRDEAYRSELAEARSELEIAESELARHRTEGNSAQMAQALSRRDELRAKIDFAESRLAWTQVKSPVSGIVVTPHLEEKAGQHLASGQELCVVADDSAVTAEVAVPEGDASLLAPGEPLWLKINSYPTRTFKGTVTRVGAAVREEGEERFVIAESRVPNDGALLKTGMVGRAKVSVGRRSVAYAFFRKPARWIWTKLWPLLP